MKHILSVSLASMLSATPIAAGNLESSPQSFVQIKSAYSVDKTVERFSTSLQAQGLTLFTQIDHAAGAQSVGQNLPPTQLLIFGNPKVGTPLMHCDRTVAIDLPQKALIWEDSAGQVWIGYTHPRDLMTRYQLKDCEMILDKVETTLRTLVTSAAQSDQNPQP